LVKRYTTQQQNNKTIFFLGFAYKVSVRVNFRRRQTQAGMQVSPATVFRVSLFNHGIIEKALWQITNMEQWTTSSAQSL